MKITTYNNHDVFFKRDFEDVESGDKKSKISIKDSTYVRTVRVQYMNYTIFAQEYIIEKENFTHITIHKREIKKSVTSNSAF